VSRHTIQQAVDRQRVRLAVAEHRLACEPDSNWYRSCVRRERRILRDLQQSLVARHRTLQ
jgi:hypothetical protein